MASGRSSGVKVPDFGPDNKAYLPQQFDFPKCVTKTGLEFK